MLKMVLIYSAVVNAKLTYAASDPFETHFANPEETTLSRRLKAVSENKWQSKKLESTDGMRTNLSIPDGEEFPSTVPLIKAIKDLKVFALLRYFIVG
jgi:hypothetical protein